MRLYRCIRLARVDRCADASNGERSAGRTMRDTDALPSWSGSRPPPKVVSRGPKTWSSAQADKSKLSD